MFARKPARQIVAKFNISLQYEVTKEAAEGGRFASRVSFLTLEFYYHEPKMHRNLRIIVYFLARFLLNGALRSVEDVEKSTS